VQKRRSAARAIAATVGIVRDEHGNVAELRWLLTDRTNRRTHAMAARAQRAELERLVAARTEEARAARLRAEQANRAKSELIAIISHELRTPLNAIAGYTELLTMGARGDLTPPQAADVGRIREAQEHLTLLVEDLLNHVRYGLDGVHFDVGEIVVGDALRFAARLLEPQAALAGVSLRLAPGDAGAVVHADAERLRQIIVNLLGNAIKFTPAAGVVELGWRGDGPHVLVFVRDTGIGIPPHELETIFRPFTQLGGEQTGGRGVGLGLSISRDLARAMGSELVVESEVGRGSVFTLRLDRSTRVAASAEG